MKNTVSKLHIRKPLFTVISLFLIAALLVVSVYAWYVRNVNIQGSSGMVLTEEGAGVYATTYTVYMYNNDFSQVNSYTSVPISLLGYDTVFIGRNVFTPVIICIPVWGTSITDGTPFTVNISCSGELFESGYSLKSSLSNVTAMRCSCLGIDPSSYSSNEALYSAAKTSLDSHPAQTFVQMHGNTAVDSGWTKNSTVSFTVTPQAGELAYVYIELEYDFTLVMTYRDQHSSDFAESFGGEGNVWHCDGDLVSISFSESDAQS